MARTVEEPLSEKELGHLQNEFWLNLSSMKEESKENAGLDRQLTYLEVMEIIDLIVVAIHFVKADFDLNPHQYGDILGAEGDFVRDILYEVKSMIFL